MKIEFCHYHPKYHSEVEKIFFQTSEKKEFESVPAKEQFYQKYLGHYLEHHTATTFVACDENCVLGYITICVDTEGDHKLLELNPHLRQYQHLYKDFPAHLHINLSPKAQGKGIGSGLLNYAFSHLKKPCAIHLITLANARNIHFYQRNHFAIVATFPDGTAFLGRILD